MPSFVIFGASGDLARHYLFPALNAIDPAFSRFRYFGFGRSPADLPSFITYIIGTYDADGLRPLASRITADTIFYFALPTRLDLIKNLIDGLISHSLISDSTRIVLEKPFGTDYASARELMDYLDTCIGQDKIFLVDHYLTKDLVKNIISLRFANPIFHHLWSNRFIKEVNITATESRGVDGRGQYYDRTGAIRDMVQNHLLQLLALTLMDSPADFSQTAYSSQKLSVLRSLSFRPKIDLGQYRGYLSEVGVAPDSATETFAKIVFKSSLPQWKKVPVTITTGKKLDQKITEINIVFKQFSDCVWGADCHRLIPNQLTITLQPQNDIILTINSSFDPHRRLPSPVSLNLGTLDNASLAYQNMLLDVISDNRLNTPTFDEILTQWQIVDKIFSSLDRSRLFTY